MAKDGETRGLLAVSEKSDFADSEGVVVESMESGRMLLDLDRWGDKIRRRFTCPFVRWGSYKHGRERTTLPSNNFGTIILISFNSGKMFCNVLVNLSHQAKAVRKSCQLDRLGSTKITKGWLKLGL